MRRVLAWLVDHPWATLGGIALVTLVFALFLPRLGFQADYSQMLPKGDPIVAQYDRARKLFGGQSLFMLAVVAEEGGTLFDLPSLQKLYRITDELQTLVDEGLLEEVISPTTAQIVRGTAAAITVRPPLPRPPETDEDVRAFQEAVLGERLVRDALIRADGSAAVLVLKAHPEYEDDEVAMGRVLAHLEGIPARHGGPESYYTSGDAAFLVYVNRYMRRDLAFLLPVVVAVVVAVLFASFRTLRGVLLPMAVVLVSLVWTMGFVGLVGAKLTMISTFLPVLLVAVGSAYGIHVVNDHNELSRRGGDRRELARRIADEMLTPIAGAALTTAAGFLTLLSAFLVPTREFGVFAAWGTMAAFVLSLTLIPAVLALLPLPRPRERPTRVLFDRLVVRGTGFVARRPVVTLVLALAVFGAFLAGIPFLKVESDVTKYFRSDSPVVRGLRFVEDRFGGSQELSVVVDTGRADGLKNPEVLRFFDRLQRFLEERPEVGSTSSLADLVKETYFTLRGDDPAFYAIPGTERAVAQVLLLYEGGGGRVTGGMAAERFRWGRIAARVRSVGLAGYRALSEAVEAFIAREKPPQVVEAYVTGSPALYVQLSLKLIQSQIVSLGTSLGAVVLLVVLVLGSLGAGLLVLVPLVVTVAGNFGVMGYAGAHLDMATVMIASLTVGIGVDYAVHFLARYRREREEADHREAFARTIATSGRGILVNAATLTLGFLVMLLSSFGALQTFGWLIALTMVSSLVGALFVLPAVLPWVRPGWLAPGFGRRARRKDLQQVHGGGA
ncbi:MAG: MMPL family transporter [Candidatus Bipolaricaulota bacterium]|nr:MMPL family transporter [Candidatus Bipolaricaulota bacterium]